MPQLARAAGPGSARPRAGPAAAPARPTRGSAAARSRSQAGCTGTIPVVWRPAGARVGRRRPRNSCSATLKPRFSSLPRSSSRVPGLQPVGQPGPVEPDGLRRAARRRRRRPRGSSAARRRVGRSFAPADLDLDRRLLAEPQLPEPDRLGAVAVAVRERGGAGRRGSRCRSRRRPPRASGRRPSSLVSGASRARAAAATSAAPSSSSLALQAARRSRSRAGRRPAAGWVALESGFHHDRQG